jgi:hypothetical protein
MKFNTNNIIGRNQELKKVTLSLDSQSVILSAHRRMGKTSLLKKLTNESNESTKYILLIEEGTKSPEEFVANLYQKLLDEHLLTANKTTKFKNWIGNIIDDFSIKDIKLPTFRPYWKDALRNIVEDLLNTQNEKQIVIMIDEFPIMLYKFILEYNIANEAIELIDTLREIRQFHNERGLKFIYCGSIGINVVIEKLKQLHNYAGEPINDMRIETLDAMTKNDAKELVEHLAKTKEINISGNKEETIKRLYESVDRLPFYIDLLIKEILIAEKDLSIDSIDEEVNNLISNAGNQGQFNHYTQRISTYYESNTAKISRYILDWISNNETLTSEDDIINFVKNKIQYDEDDIKLVLKKLFDDLYLERRLENGKRSYRFKYELLRKWWLVNFG